MTTDTIDRMSATRRPSGRTVMYQRWANLLFLHWPVPVEALRPHVPSELEIDTFEGSAYVGLVPFTMTGVRPVWSPAVPGLSNFHEVNVRTYVHDRGKNPGVWFCSLDAAQTIAVKLARTLWHLPYHYARMSLDHKADGTIRYRSDRKWPGPLPASCDITYRPEGEPLAARPGTIEHFLAERYILYANTPRGLRIGRVHHTPYPLQPASVTAMDESLIAAVGVHRPHTTPLAHYAREVRVRIFPLLPLA